MWNDPMPDPVKRYDISTLIYLVRNRDINPDDDFIRAADYDALKLDCEVLANEVHNLAGRLMEATGMSADHASALAARLARAEAERDLLLARLKSLIALFEELRPTIEACEAAVRAAAGLGVKP